MRAFQRVTAAQVSVENELVAQIGHGVLAFIAIQPDDTEAKADKLLHKLLNYRIFADEQAKMNRSLVDVAGGLLLVSQFTLAADTNSGLRPSFSSAASPLLGKDYLTICLTRRVNSILIQRQVVLAPICRSL